MHKLAIFASGSGTNAENIIKYFKNHHNISVDIVLTNRADAFVIERAKKFGIEYLVFDRTDFYESDKIINILAIRKIEYIILSGFLWMIPAHLIEKFDNRIINIHPALLPHYGGKGMYGMKVHEAVLRNGEKKSGISIHFVNENYDEGKLIFQATVDIDASDTPETLADKVHALEYKHFPKVIEDVIINF